jgi:hypothetical protein
MSGPEILKETQRVVNPKLIDDQEQLAEYKQQLDKANSAFEKNEASLGEKERRVASMEKDVRKHKQKKQIEDDVSRLPACCGLDMKAYVPLIGRNPDAPTSLCGIRRAKDQSRRCQETAQSG